MDDRYEELRAAMEAATPGPWHTKTECPGKCCWHIFPDIEMFGAGKDTPIVMGECSGEDAAFMVAARNALPGLLEGLDQLREALAVAHDHIDMSRLEVSHRKDATLIRAALAQE